MPNSLSGLHFFTNSLDSTHLSHALDLYKMAQEKVKNSSDVDWVTAHRLSMSCIIHAFAGLESTVNYFGYELFSNADSPRFVPNEQRDPLLKRFIRSWHNASCVEKLLYILYHSAKQELPAKLETQLRELNNLRNWLVHGFSYKTTFLVDDDIDDPLRGNVIDMEESVDWRSKFPNTNFKSLNNTDNEDAYACLSIVFEVLTILLGCTDHSIAVWSYDGPEIKLKYLFRYGLNTEKLIQEW